MSTYKIKKNTQRYITSQGLSANIWLSDTAVNPQIESQTKIVRGIHIVDTDKRKDQELYALVGKECKEVGITPSDIKWLPIYEDRRYAVTFSLEPVSEVREAVICGFIYIKTAKALQLFGDYENDFETVVLSDDSQKDIAKLFKQDLARFSAYINREVYDIEIMSNDILLDRRLSVIDANETGVDLCLRSAVEGCVLDIENSQSPKANVVLKIKADDYCKYTSVLADEMVNIKSKFGYVPAFGGIRISVHADGLESLINLASLPPLKSFGAGSETFIPVDNLWGHIDDLNGTGDYDPVSVDEFEAIYANASMSYQDMPLVIVAGLLHMLFDDSDFIKVKGKVEMV